MKNGSFHCLFPFSLCWGFLDFPNISRVRRNRFFTPTHDYLQALVRKGGSHVWENKEKEGRRKLSYKQHRNNFIRSLAQKNKKECLQVTAKSRKVCLKGLPGAEKRPKGPPARSPHSITNARAELGPTSTRNIPQSASEQHVSRVSAQELHAHQGTFETNTVQSSLLIRNPPPPTPHSLTCLVTMETNHICQSRIWTVEGQSSTCCWVVWLQNTGGFEKRKVTLAREGGGGCLNQQPELRGLLTKHPALHFTKKWESNKY